MADDVRSFPTEPWGDCRPTGASRIAIHATRGLAFPLLKQAALGLRRLVRPGLDHVDVRLWGLRLRLAANGNLAEGRLIFVPRSWDRPERKLIEKHLPPGGTFVDVGANAGGYVWWVLSLLGHECRVLAIEPDPLLVASLRFNLRTNAADNVRLVPVAIGTEPGRQPLVISSGNRGENRLEPGVEPGADGGEVVRVRRLEEVIRSGGLEAVDVLKIDIEGLEVDVLLDFYATAPRSLWPRLLITERKETPEHDRLEACLERRGYGILKRTKRNIVCGLEARG